MFRDTQPHILMYGNADKWSALEEAMREGLPHEVIVKSAKSVVDSLPVLWDGTDGKKKLSYEPFYPPPSEPERARQITKLLIELGVIASNGHGTMVAKEVNPSWENAFINYVTMPDVSG